MLTLSLLAQLSSAQFPGDTTEYKLEYGTEDLGSMLATGNSPPSGYNANSEYWDWTDGWPATDFRMIEDSSVTVSTSADRATNGDFPSQANTKLPNSIGTNDLMYAVAICSGDPLVCTGAGYLWVEDDGDTLNWYLRSDWSEDRYTTTASDTVHFDHLVASPSTNDNFRYLSYTVQ